MYSKNLNEKYIMADLVLEIGTKVVKLSGKPFKSTLKVNTVKD